MSANMDIDGIGSILDKIELLGLNMDKTEDEALNAAAKPILESAKQNIELNKSIRTGKLLKSMKLSKPRKGSYKYISVFTKDPVAHLVELGHGGPKPAPAHPFLGPAFENNKNLVKEIIIEKLRAALK